MLDKKLVELEECVFNTQKISKEQFKHIQLNDTKSLIKELNGMPLAYYSWDDICKKTNSELEDFIEEVSYIEEAIDSSEIFDMTVGQGLDRIRLSSESEIVEHDKITEILQNELSFLVNSNKSEALKTVVSDILIADRYICFNATKRTNLIIRDFSIVDEKLDFNIYLPKTLTDDRINFEESDTNFDLQILQIVQALLSLLRNKKSDFYSIMYDWVKKCEIRFNERLLLSNYFIPYLRKKLNSGMNIELNKRTRYHNQILLADSNKKRLRERVVSLQTYKKLNKLHNASNEGTHWDMHWNLSKLIYKMNFVDLTNIDG